MSSFAGILKTAKNVQIMEFWGELAGNTLVINQAAGDKNISDIVVSGLPTDCSIIRVELLLNLTNQVNVFTSGNNLAGVQKLRVKKSTGTWDVDDVDGISLDTSDIYMRAASESIGAALLHGDADVKSEVDGDATYNVQLEDAKAAEDLIYLTGGQPGLRFFFK